MYPPAASTARFTASTEFAGHATKVSVTAVEHRQIVEMIAGGEDLLRLDPVSRPSSPSAVPLAVILMAEADVTVLRMK
jgi:hypothetical protein